MKEKIKNNIDVAVERLLADHLFDPTDKPGWINKLVEEGLIEEESRRAYKIAARKYHTSRNEHNNKKQVVVLRLGGLGWLLGLLPFVIILLIILGIYYISKHPSPSDEVYPYSENSGEQYCGPGGSPCY